MPMISAQYSYESRQQFNFVLSWFHSRRYRAVLGILKEIPRTPIRIIEIGCAHGKLFSILRDRFLIDYTGIDTNPDFLSIAQQRYGHYDRFTLICGPAQNYMASLGKADAIVALETLEHISQREVVQLLEQIAVLRPARFVCSVPVEVGSPVYFKQLGSFLMEYFRVLPHGYREEYTWKETLWAGLYRLDKLPPHARTHKGFDWRSLTKTISRYMHIRRIEKLPFWFLPPAFSTSVLIVAEPFKGHDG